MKQKPIPRWVLIFILHRATQPTSNKKPSKPFLSSSTQFLGYQTDGQRNINTQNLALLFPKTKTKKIPTYTCFNFSFLLLPGTNITNRAISIPNPHTKTIETTYNQTDLTLNQNYNNFETKPHIKPYIQSNWLTKLSDLGESSTERWEFHQKKRIYTKEKP